MLKKIIIPLSVLLIAVGVFFAIMFFSKTSLKGGLIKNSPQKTTGNVYLKYALPTDDKDFDGVTDELEKQKGTSSETNDTDGDGLTDKIEIETTKTDPTKFDTDGDGFGDGVEIIKGFNPNGPGKLK